MVRQQQKGAYKRIETAILFADVKGFSRLTDHQSRVFLETILPLIGDSLRIEAPRQANTWGDGIVAFFDSATAALRAALSLRDAFRGFDWSSSGLPRLEIRVALHAGEAFEGWDPVRGSRGMIGVEINRAARIEPVVAPNHVYVTEDFRIRCRSEGIAFHDLGSVPLAKSWGDDRLYVATWLDEKIDTLQIVRTGGPAILDLLDPERLLAGFGYSLFARRLSVCAQAKRDLAKHAVESGLWVPKEPLFLQSGTIPVYLMAEMLRRVKSEDRPSVVITNSTVLPLMGALSEKEDDDSQIVYPDEGTVTRYLRDATRVAAAPPMFTIGGVLMENAAAVLPRGYFEEGELLRLACEELLAVCAGNKITHVMMMMTGFRPGHGPFALSDGWRKFNKTLLYYVAQQPEVKLTLFGESDKLIKLIGEPADTVVLPLHQGDQPLWPALQCSKRTTIVIAEGCTGSEADRGYLRRQLAQVEADGMVAIFVPAS